VGTPAKSAARFRNIQYAINQLIKALDSDTPVGWNFSVYLYSPCPKCGDSECISGSYEHTHFSTVKLHCASCGFQGEILEGESVYNP
jgi:predicted RNA-binding Zn-ribbon protein involved in translation (DUF1610 family)